MQVSGMTLDRFDLALLDLLQADNLMTADALAAHVALSPSAINRRVKRLRESGAIAANRALLAEVLTRHWLRAVIHVQLHDHAPAAGLAGLRRRLTACPEIQACFEVSGPFDLMLLVAVRDMAAFNAFADEVLVGEPVVRRYETSFVKKELKLAPVYPLAG